jgi:hypothetical protein
MKLRITTFSISLLLLYLMPCNPILSQAKKSSDYSVLISLFKEWRTFENPPLRNGAPDYTAATFSKRWPVFKQLQSKLHGIDTTAWSIEHKVDWMLVWAEMNGPTNHASIDTWKYKFPLSQTDKNKLIEQLKVIEPLYEQAKLNLTGNAKELWIAGIRDIQYQINDLYELLDKTGVREDPGLSLVIKKSIAATEKLVKWLEAGSAKKTGPSGIGQENYTW